MHSSPQVDPVSEQPDAPWLGLIVGNTRLHWGIVYDGSVETAWHTSHLTPDTANFLMEHQFSPAAWHDFAADQLLTQPLFWEDSTPSLRQPQRLVCASVVPQQTALLRAYPAFQEISLSDLPLDNLYPNLGIDRALNLLGASKTFGWPILVIDAGTAITFTAGEGGNLSGGAILPGLSLQINALTQQTATLSATDFLRSLPPRWSVNTSDAIRSGISYGVLATVMDFIRDWRERHLESSVVLTGGDGEHLLQWLTEKYSISQLHHVPNLAMQGLLHCRRHLRSK